MLLQQHIILLAPHNDCDNIINWQTEIIQTSKNIKLDINNMLELIEKADYMIRQSRRSPKTDMIILAISKAIYELSDLIKKSGMLE